MQYETTTKRKLLTNKHLHLQFIKRQKIEKALREIEKSKTMQNTKREKTRLTVRVGFSPKSKTRPESYIYLGQVLTQYS